MKKPVKMKHYKKTSRLPVYLLLAVVATMLAATGTLAKYTSRFNGTVSMQTAAFAGGGSMDFDLSLENMSPGETRTTRFTVQNYEDGRECDVEMEYEIKIDTMGNLPLTFSLLGQKEAGDGDSTLVGELNDQLLATGGKLPISGGAEGKKRKHSYELSIRWPATETDGDYSEEIDMVTVTVTTKQVQPAEEEPQPAGSSGPSGGESAG